jgi:hypothetical protein
MPYHHTTEPKMEIHKPQLNPTPPSIRGLIKLHKQGQTKRPIVNWTNAPAYKTAKLLTEKLALYIPLPYAFNIKNPTQLITDLNDLRIDPNLKFGSFDINNMYPNIPTTELTNIIAKTCDQHDLPQTIKLEILSLSDTLIAQNYFRYKDTTYIQTEGLLMGATTSSIFSEIYIQHLETTKTADILIQHHIVGYFRYVDDILIVYKHSLTDIQNVLSKFNNLTPSLKFTMEEEKDNSINFFEITITKKKDHLSYTIYRKPTTTDSIIPNDSCHPTQHKMAAIRILTKRRHIPPGQ